MLFDGLFRGKSRNTAANQAEPSDMSVKSSGQEIVFEANWPVAMPGRTGRVESLRTLLTDTGPLSASDIQKLKPAVLGDASDPLLLIAPEFTTEAVALLQSKGAYAVLASDLGVERMDEVLADIGILTRSRVFAAALGIGLDAAAAGAKTQSGLLVPGMTWSDVSPEDLGRAASVTVDEHALTLRVSQPRELDTHLSGLLKQFQYALNDADREAIARRFARFGRSVGNRPPPENDGTVSRDAIMIPGGYVSYYCITDPTRAVADLAKAHIMIADLELTDMEHVKTFADIALSHDLLPLVVIARRLDRGALALLTVNKLRGVLPASAVRVAVPTAEITPLLERIARATGGTLIRTADQLCNFQVSCFGHAARVLSTRGWTIISP